MKDSHQKVARIVLLVCATLIIGCSTKRDTPSSTQPSPSSPEPDQETGSLTGSPGTPVAANPAITCDATQEEIKSTFLKLLNEARATPRQCGNTTHDAVDPVTWNEQLNLAASQHSIDMTTNNFFSHTGSDNSSVSDRVGATGYNWQAVGENIAAGQRSAQAAMDGWLKSPGHCQNIMNPNFTEIGVACDQSDSARYGAYWTNVFGRSF